MPRTLWLVLLPTLKSLSHYFQRRTKRKGPITVVSSQTNVLVWDDMLVQDDEAASRGEGHRNSHLPRALSPLSPISPSESTAAAPDLEVQAVSQHPSVKS